MTPLKNPQNILKEPAKNRKNIHKNPLITDKKLINSLKKLRKPLKSDCKKVLFFIATGIQGMNYFFSEKLWVVLLTSVLVISWLCLVSRICPGCALKTASCRYCLSIAT
jgi:hypothetical protein